MSNKKTLFYDIETTVLLGYVFSLGKQVLRHNQLLKGYFSRTHITCLSYMWDTDKEASVITWGKSVEEEKAMLEKFDELAHEADVIIGKNNFRFDDKHIATQRLWFDMPGRHDWKFKTDDLESQARRTFALPSQSLDYISEQLGLGGKDKMGFDDWVDIANIRLLDLLDDVDKKSLGKLTKTLFGKSYREVSRDGRRAEKKMGVYNQKDVEDTKAIWDYCVKHFSPKYNRAVEQLGLSCKRCGSSNIITAGGPKVSGSCMYQYYFCKNCNGSAGRALYNPVKRQVTGKVK